ncbi:hypothetical protein M9458_051737 [Cirrhinus mrigala]|uniref:Integrase catalytic domain-containing protein n=1 Tax=Cirrhinus mrigala TaxID=683832 RepID=A0ABD0MSG1_CIRMR
MMRLQRYDMELVYTQGKHIVLADALSGAVVQGGEHAESSTDSKVTHHVNMIAETLPVTDTKLKQIAVETEKDRCLQQVVTHLNDGWPRGECAQYYNIRTELSVHHAKQQKEPMTISDQPDEPWQKVGTDLFFLDGQNCLLVIDYLSNYPEIALLSSTSAAGVVTHMKAIFARHGIPQVVCSDNGPCYSSRDFPKFAEEYGFQHVTSNPLYP